MLIDVDFGSAGNSGAYVLDGWAEAEAHHRWTWGCESRMWLPVADPGPDCVLVINATPCRHPPCLTGQMVMVSIDDRLLATVAFSALQVVAFRFPRGLAGTGGGAALGITHLSAAVPRAPEQRRHGRPLGLMMHRLRVFRLPPTDAVPDAAPICRPRLVGAAAERRTALARPALAQRFESLGQGCHFGLVQRRFGAEPLGLLRFVDATTAHLFEGLVAGFRGVGAPGRLALAPTEDVPPRYRWEHSDYHLMYDTRLRVDAASPETVMRQQSRRLAFLQRKFIEDLHAGEKIFVLTRGDCLTEPEALAIFCALRLHGPNTLLWTVFGDAAAAGRVERATPHLLCGHLGDTDEHRYATDDVWLSVMANAYSLADRRAAESDGFAKKQAATSQ